MLKAIESPLRIKFIDIRARTKLNIRSKARSPEGPRIRLNKLEHKRVKRESTQAIITVAKMRFFAYSPSSM